MKVPKAEVERRVEGFKAACRTAGLRLTHQRIEIFREVAASLDHPDAETVFRAVVRRMPTSSLDTVYRTLSLMGELGLVRTLGPRRDSVRFDANLDRHHHFVCTRCGLTRDFHSAELDAVTAPDAAKRFGTVTDTHVEVRGVCEDCTRKQAGKPAHTNPSKPGGERRN
jgi:Fur family transcriptional regulator, peroxide stress response regulator